MEKVVIGSRGSDLALWQANFVKAELEKLGNEVEIKIIKTQGDIIQHLSFDKLEGKGFFTKEIENELLSGAVDVAVHSHKDLETNPPEGLAITAVSDRENPAELLLIRKEAVDENEIWGLKQEAIIGTSSARRKSQILSFRPDTSIKDLRGNVPTRIDKLRNGDYDAIMLAKAGVARLKLDVSDLHTVELDPTQFVPAPAQGVLGLQIRVGDARMKTILEALNNGEVQYRIGIERKILNLLDGGCQLPLGAYFSEDEKLYISFANNWADGASFYEYEAAETENLAEIVVADLKGEIEEIDA